MINLILDPLTATKEILAAQTATQSFLNGAADADAAKAFIHLLGCNNYRLKQNHIIIGFGDYGRNRQAITNAAKWEPRSGNSVRVYFRGYTSAEDDASGYDAVRDTYCDHLHGIQLAIETAAAASGAPFYKEIIMVVEPQRIIEDKRASIGDYFESEFEYVYTRQPEVSA